LKTEFSYQRRLRPGLGVDGVIGAADVGAGALVRSGLKAGAGEVHPEESADGTPRMKIRCSEMSQHDARMRYAGVLKREQPGERADLRALRLLPSYSSSSAVDAHFSSHSPPENIVVCKSRRRCACGWRGPLGEMPFGAAGIPCAAGPTMSPDLSNGWTRAPGF